MIPGGFFFPAIDIFGKSWYNEKGQEAAENIMRTGVSTASLFQRKNNEEALPFLDSLGIGTAEVFFTSFSEYGREFGRTAAKGKGKVDVHSVHVLNTQFEPQLFSAHPRVNADAFGWLDRALAGGAELGAKYYTFHGLARIKRAARSGEGDDLPALARGLARIGEFCAARGFSLCLENVEWALYNRPGVFAAMKEGCPGLAGVLDVKQARISRYPYPMYLNEMAGRIAHVHVSDVDERGNICLPGRGIFDFSELLKRLADTGFDGPLLVEVYKDDYSDPRQLKEACDYLDELLYKFGFSDRR